MTIYLAARYSRRLELCAYAETLRSLGATVRARWLSGSHQIDDSGEPLGELGEAAIESGEVSAEKFAVDDLQDVLAADVVICFTEPPRSTATRGGRHVEMGIAIASHKKVLVVGYRENVFCWLPEIKFFADVEPCFKWVSDCLTLSRLLATLSGDRS